MDSVSSEPRIREPFLNTPMIDVNDNSKWWVVVIFGCTIALIFLARSELHRVENGTLFACSMSWEMAPSEVELIDAKMTAKSHQVTAAIAVSLVGVLFAFASTRLLSWRASLSTISRTVLIFFFAAVFADLITTIWFFHHQGIDHELHPGVRLFGYAYGRTVGPLAGKTVQAIGTVGLAVVAGRAGNVLLFVVAVVYSLGAVYNLSQAI